MSMGSEKGKLQVDCKIKLSSKAKSKGPIFLKKALDYSLRVSLENSSLKSLSWPRNMLTLKL